MFLKGGSINISDFKARALELISEIAKKGKEYTITRRGVPVAKVVPYKTTPRNRSGSLKGQIEIRGDIVHFDTSSDWEVLGK